jgi:hypothetical protein
MIYLKDYRGRLGNNLFQIACTIGYAKYNGTDFAIPLQFKYSNEFTNLKNNYYVSISQDVQHDIKLPILPGYISKHTITNAVLSGIAIRYQNVRLFENYRSDIVKFLTPQWDVKKNDVCCVHVRLTDYLNDDVRKSLVLLDVDYYIKAIKYVQNIYSNIDVVLVTDDPVVCRRMLGNKYPIVNGDMFEDFKLMMSAKAVIISNSTFSWWAAYLNMCAELIVMPSVWYGYAHCDKVAKNGLNLQVLGWHIC